MSKETDSSRSHEDVELVSKDESKSELGSATDLDDVFDIQSEVARGGMGIIYKGFHKKLQRICAIKVLQPVDQEDLALKRFIKEARLICSFDHPNIVKIFIVGFDRSKRPFFAMEWLEGMTLDSYLAKKRRIKFTDFKDIFTQVLNALSYAHSKNIIHRDIKPSNIFLAKDEQGRSLVKLLDFGIARSLDQTESASMKLTSTGSLLGTPRYMSPEQCNSQPSDKRTDIYSISAVMYEALAGVHLFEGDNPLELMYKQLKEKPDASKLPKDQSIQKLNACILKGLEKDPDARQENIDQLSKQLHEALSELSDEDLPESTESSEPESNKKRITQLVAFTILGLLITVLASFFLLSTKHSQPDETINRASMFPKQSKLPCHVYRSKAHDMVRQYQIAKKRKKWDEADEYGKEVERLFRRGIDVGSKKIAELKAQTRLTSTQTAELIHEQNEVHNVAHELAEFLFDQGRVEDSFREYKLAEEYASTNFNLSTTSVYRQGTVLEYQQKFDQALAKLFKQAKWADEILKKYKPPYSTIEGDIKPDREYWDKRAELWQTIGEVYSVSGKPHEAAAAYKKALYAAEMNKRDENTISMTLRASIALFEQGRWQKVYEEASANSDFNSFRASEAMRLYAFTLKDNNKPLAKQVFEHAMAAIEKTSDRPDTANADCLGHVIQGYADSEIENELNKPGADDFKSTVAIAKRGELFAQDRQYSARLRGSTNYVRGVVAYLGSDYDKALNLFELVELDCLTDPYSVAHLAKLLRAEVLLKKGMPEAAQKQFLDLDITRLPFAECIRVGPAYLTQALMDSAEAFEKAHKPEAAKMIREKIEKSGRLKAKKS
jgi:serine/threonine protein kinase